jgi:hypothetical protein
MINLLKSMRFVAFTHIALGVVIIIDVLLGGSSIFPKVLRLVLAGVVLIMGIAFLFYKERPDSPALKENR